MHASTLLKSNPMKRSTQNSSSIEELILERLVVESGPPLPPLRLLSATRRMFIQAASLASVGLCSLTAAFGLETAPAADPAKIEFFEKKIRPLLVENCFNCHS